MAKRFGLIPGLLAVVMARTAAVRAAQFPVRQIDAVFSRTAQQLPGPVYKYSWPRTDLHVKVAGTPIVSGLALGSWAAFTPVRDKTWMMGDLVLLQSEVGPVVQRLQAGGIDVTAIHNHLLEETPRVMYVHYIGAGDPVEIAKTLKAALERSHTPLKSEAKSTTNQQRQVPQWVSQLENALGRKGKLSGRVYSVSLPRADVIQMDGHSIPPAMGIATALNFQELGEKVASTGDFVLIATEVNPVIKALQQHAVTVTALHNHMLEDDPHLFFLHYWAVGIPARVGAALKAALARVNVRTGE